MKRLPKKMQETIEVAFATKGHLVTGSNCFKDPSRKVYRGYVEFCITPETAQYEYAEVSLLTAGSGRILKGAVSIRPNAQIEGVDTLIAARATRRPCKEIRQEINSIWSSKVIILARGETPDEAKPYIPSKRGTGVIYGLRRLPDGATLGKQGRANLADQDHWSEKDLSGKYTLVKYRQKI